MQNLLKEAEAITETVIAHRRHLHACPEVGFDLAKTADYVQKTLCSLGYEPKTVGQCGIVADIGEGDDCVLLRADMDALPITEEASLPFSAQNGSMHACGHDMHTAMLLGAAELLKSREKFLKNRVRLMFQPAEETLSGAADMITHGVLSGVSRAFMLHVMTAIDLPTGTIVLPPAEITAPAADFFKITVRGHGVHGAMASEGTDPIMAAAHILLSLDSIRTRELALSEAAAITVGSFQAGAAANVIPEEAVLRGTVRSYDDTLEKHLRARITEIAEGTAKVFSAAARTEFFGSCPTLRNDAALLDTLASSLPSLLGPERVLTPKKMGKLSKNSGSEDFAHITHKVPSVMLALAAGRTSEGYMHPLHHSKVMFDEGALPVGAALYAFLGLQSYGQTEKGPSHSV